MILDPDRCWHAVETGDPRFDGWVFCGVTSTGIYCRPSCPARTPKRQNVRFYASAAAAQTAGFRACKRCRPDATPGSPEWDRRADLVGRAMRLIADGVVDREGVSGLAQRLGYAERHVHRQLVAVVGAGPLALARAQRAQTARVLVETTDLPIAHVAFASGFRSVRQFNATVREVFATTPSELRARAGRHGRPVGSGAVVLRLPYRAPLDAAGLIAFLSDRAVPGIEEGVDGGYRRSLGLPHGAGVVELRPAEGYIQARYWLDDLRDLATAVQRSRTLLDLDSDPQAVVDALRPDPLLGPMIRSVPGRRVAGAVDGDELAVRAVLGQQISLAGAATLAGRLVAEYGTPLDRPIGGLTHVFPSAPALAATDPECLAMPTARRRALLGLTRALADGEISLDVGTDLEQTQQRLLALPGIGPWTVAYVGMRVLRDRVPPHRPWCSARARESRSRREPGCGGPPRRAVAPVPGLRAAASVGPPGFATCGSRGRRMSTDPTWYTIVASPIGDLLLLSDGHALRGLSMQEGRRPIRLQPQWQPAAAPFAAVLDQLTEYFAGERTTFDVPLRMDGSPFQVRVWRALCDIPYGTTTSYGELARRVGKPSAARAVGLANGRNPIAVIVPCHRVIGADGSLTGYGGGLERKRFLLGLEGDASAGDAPQLRLEV